MYGFSQDIGCNNVRLDDLRVWNDSGQTLEHIFMCFALDSIRDILLSIRQMAQAKCTKVRATPVKRNFTGVL